MNATKTRVVMVTGVMVVLIVGLVGIVGWKRARAAASKEVQTAKMTSAVKEIERVNVGRPELQVQAKTLIFAAMIQKKIPAAADWCETINVGGKVWPVTPTNTFFAINSQVAGRPYSRSTPLRGDVVVFFETENPGWNQAGGAELLASRPDGVAVALADGRAIIATPADVANLHWSP